MKLAFSVITSVLILNSTIVVANELSGYGTAHGSVDATRVSDDGRTSLSSNSSHVGVKGNYQLNSDYVLLFQYEQGVDIFLQGDLDGNTDNNNNNNNNNKLLTDTRTSFLGLRGNLGQIKVGHLAALDQWTNDYNLFRNQVGDLRNLWADSGLAGRSDKVVSYSSPRFNNMLQDVSVSLSYKFEDGHQDNSHIIMKGNYQHDRLKVGVALASFAQAENNASEHTLVAFTSSYSLDYFTFGGGLQSEFNVKGKDNSDRDSVFFGSTVKFSDKGKFKLQISRSIGTGVDRDAIMFAWGYDYQLNANTLLYAAYAYTANEYNVAFNVNGKGHGDKVDLELGESPGAFSIGIIYNFDVDLTDHF
ncbi:porin [Colwellia piezophila]|uniref:porin n=1 Tax=Colwellia piezophila TaxID=211668 RepID=UPI00036A960D|nr:porin [Colwellia piezophila]